MGLNLPNACSRTVKKQTNELQKRQQRFSDQRLRSKIYFLTNDTNLWASQPKFSLKSCWNHNKLFDDLPLPLISSLDRSNQSNPTKLCSSPHVTLFLQSHWLWEGRTNPIRGQYVQSITFNHSRMQKSTDLNGTRCNAEVEVSYWPQEWVCYCFETSAASFK